MNTNQVSVPQTTVATGTSAIGGIVTLLFILLIIAFVAWIVFMSTMAKVANAMDPFHGGIHLRL